MEMMMREFEEMKRKIDMLTSRNAELEQIINTKNEIEQSLPTELPYDKDELMKAVYKYNPYNLQYSIRRNGWVSKDIRLWYTLKYLNLTDYPEEKSKFYQKCLKEILKNIPINKLPYKVLDSGRYIFNLYDYTEKRWIRGKTKDFIELIIKKFVGLIYLSLCSSINVLNELTHLDIEAIERRRINALSLANLKRNLQVELTYRFSLPEHDMEMSDEDKYNFYKRHFVKLFTDRLSPDYQYSDEKIELVDNLPIVTENSHVERNFGQIDFDDENYDFDVSDGEN